MHEGRKDVVSGKHIVISEKVQCDENRKQRGKEGSADAGRSL